MTTEDGVAVGAAGVLSGAVGGGLSGAVDISLAELWGVSYSVDNRNAQSIVTLGQWSTVQIGHTRRLVNTGNDAALDLEHEGDRLAAFNLHHRHLTSQRSAVVGLELLPQLEAVAKARQSASGRRAGSLKGGKNTERVPSLKTASDTAGELVGVGRGIPGQHYGS